MSSGPCASLPCHDRTADREGRARHGRVAAMARRPPVGGGLGRARDPRDRPRRRERGRRGRRARPAVLPRLAAGRPPARRRRARRAPPAPRGRRVVRDARRPHRRRGAAVERHRRRRARQRLRRRDRVRVPGRRVRPGPDRARHARRGGARVADGVAFPNGIAITARRRRR